MPLSRNSCLWLVVLTVLLLTSAAPADEVDWQVVASGGSEAASTSYQISGTVGQAAVGPTGSASYLLSQGYWQNFEVDTTSCCNGIRGNVDGDIADAVNIVDMTYLVAYLFSGGPSPVCVEEANVDGSAGEVINIVDMTFLVAFLFSGGPPPPNCP